jgi:hypothetical protein
MTRLGWAASSPSTAAASNPMKPVKARITARKSPWVLGARPGSNGRQVRPWAPPWATMARDRATIVSTPITAKTSCTRVETRMSARAITRISASRMQYSGNQPRCTLVLAVSTAERKSAEMIKTNEIPIANAVAYIQPARKPGRRGRRGRGGHREGQRQQGQGLGDGVGAAEHAVA